MSECNNLRQTIPSLCLTLTLELTQKVETTSPHITKIK